MISTELASTPPIDLPGAVRDERPRQSSSIRPKALSTGSNPPEELSIAPVPTSVMRKGVEHAYFGKSPNELIRVPTSVMPKGIDTREDIREALYNDGQIGPASMIQLPLENITSLSGIIIDLDPGLFQPDNPLFPPSEEPAEFYEKIKPVLDRHPLARHAEVRASGTGLHVILRIDPPVELRSNGDQKYWAAIVKAVQISLPADRNAPGITALTRAIGSLNSKNGRPVEQLAAGRPVRPAEIVDFLEQLSATSFRTIGRILLGADRVDVCPRCQNSALTLYDHRGQCYRCGLLSLDDLFDTIYMGAEPDQACGTARRKSKARKA